MEKHAVFIEELYGEVTKAFLANVSEENKKRFGEAYVVYLHRQYDEYFVNIDETRLNSVAMTCVTREKLINIPKKEMDKKAFLFPDPEYLALEQISLEIGDFAKSKKSGAHIDVIKTKEEYSNILHQHFAKVSDLFKFTAEKVLSEAILDLEYIFGNGESRSFRT